MPEGPFAVDMSAPAYSASESRGPPGLSPDDVLPACSTPDVVVSPYSAGSRQSRLPIALTLTSHSDRAWAGTQLALKTVSQTHWEPRPELDIDLNQELSESRDSDP